MSDVQGFHVQITIDGNEVTAYGNSIAIGRDLNVMEKMTMDGTGVPLLLAGQATGTLTLEGQVDTAGQRLLEATFAARLPVAASVEVGDGATIDAGTYSGTIIVSSLPVEAAADDTWNFTLDATGYLDYTAPA